MTIQADVEVSSDRTEGQIFLVFWAYRAELSSGARADIQIHMHVVGMKQSAHTLMLHRSFSLRRLERCARNLTPDEDELAIVAR